MKNTIHGPNFVYDCSFESSDCIARERTVIRPSTPEKRCFGVSPLLSEGTTHTLGSRQLHLRYHSRVSPFPDQGHYSLIIVRIILNLVTAETAWGSFAGKMMESPSFMLY